MDYWQIARVFYPLAVISLVATGIYNATGIEIHP
jgi:hypothetical protein